MSKIAQIGAGMIGKTMAHDLSKDHEVKVGDCDVEALKSLTNANPSIATCPLDAQDENDIYKFIQDADIVLLAVPGFLGYKHYKPLSIMEKTLWIFHFKREFFRSKRASHKKRGYCYC